MRSGDLLVEVDTKKQAQNIIKLKALATIPVSVSPHTSLNFSKGVITCGELYKVPLEEISSELKKQVTCARCAEKGHDSQQCTAQEKCVNCGGDHPSYSRTCSRWKLEKEIITIKIKEDLTYPEARRKIEIQTPTPGISYSSVVKKSFCSNCSCANCKKQNSTTQPPEKTSESDSDSSTKNFPDSSKQDPDTHRKARKNKSQTSLTLKLAKRGLSQKDLSVKFKKSNLRNSVALGLANQNIVHKDFTTIFGDTLTNPDFKLHPSEDEDSLDMSCEDLATPTNARPLSSSKPL
ncbi:uncharacterized protein LOC129968319 [Argiope bruennichi]|uniref:uncharacterized protein LOC129968319 n=1 Tax=Argiope bruennichi TaxID=94029 RepID=UPI0024950026|nr:uncharacterized protein LOC129968319 [Argiope bruennichi]